MAKKEACLQGLCRQRWGFILEHQKGQEWGKRCKAEDTISVSQWNMIQRLRPCAGLKIGKASSSVKNAGQRWNGHVRVVGQKPRQDRSSAAKAGVQNHLKTLDSGFRRNDGND